MPFYSGLRRETPEVQMRTAQGLLALKKGLEADVPRRTISDTLLLATWNIREFDSNKYGERCTESFYYIAEIIDHFDIVAVQEVREDLRALDRLMDILGSWWKYIVTDVTLGRGGNGERMAFLYDSRKVAFAGLAGELVLPAKKERQILQFARTPFICGFKAGWSKFNLCTVHIYYGTAKPDDPRRVEEIEELAELLGARAERGTSQPGDAKARNEENENLILLGDFNIFNPKDPTMAALTRNGFKVPKGLQDVSGSNLDQEKYYDQIAFRGVPHRFEATNEGGVFNFYDYVFKPGDAKTYANLINEYRSEAKKPKITSAKALEKDYKMWRTFQMSDHLVLWTEFRVDFSAEYLGERAAQAAGE